MTLSRDRRSWLEVRYGVPKGCGAMLKGEIAGPEPLSESGRIDFPGTFSATIRGATASGVLALPNICEKTFSWTARRQP